MNRLWSTIALLLLASGAMLAAATEFTTIDRRLLPASELAKPDVQREMAESVRPADLDPEGNWGQSIEGFQLSLRFAKQTYAVGEPIYALFFLRNVAGESRQVTEEYPERDFQFFVSKERVLAPATPYGVQNSPGYTGPRVSRGLSLETIPPWHQKRYGIHLNSLFNLDAPGEYVIYVTRQVPKLDGSGKTELRSGNAIIRVVAGSNLGGTQTSTGSSPTGGSAKEAPTSSSETKTNARSAVPLLLAAQARATGSTQVRASATSSDRNPTSSPIVASTVPAANATTQPQNLLFAAITAALLAFIALILWRARRRA